MPHFAHFLFLIAIAVAPPGTHAITVSSGAESYHWNLNDNEVDGYSCSQLQPYGKIAPHIATEHPILTNHVIPDGYTSDDATTAQISAHKWDHDHILKFDDDHQLEKDPGGF